MANPRISGRRGQVSNLDVTFFRGGVPTAPFAIRKVEIYKTQVLPHNLVATYPVVDPSDGLYPSPVEYVTEVTPAGACGTDPVEGSIVAGKYILPFDVPNDLAVPDVYYDVWYYYADDPRGELGTDDPFDADLDSEDYEPLLLSCCHRFWLYPDEWFCADALQSVNFGFEPLNQKFYSPEVKPLEVGLMPLPLYDYNFNLVNPMIPFINGTITIETVNHEKLVDNAPMTIGLRQGSYRVNPWVMRYNVDTTDFLKGTYRYRIMLNMPDGTSRVSPTYYLTVG